MPGRILIAEDDRVLSEIVRFSLDRAGYEVVVAHDGSTALQEVQQNRFDLIISDYQMPRLNGEELCRRVREDSANRETPIIFCSAKGYEVYTEQLTSELQLSAVFFKPFSPRELVESVSNTLNAPAAVG